MEENPIIYKVIENYDLDGVLEDALPYGNGHINDTILLTYNNNGAKDRFVLQKINKFVFHHPDELMDNFIGITDHLRKKIIARGGDPMREVLTTVRTRDGNTFVIDEKGDYWRITLFIDGATCYEHVSKPDDLYEAGLAFGRFQADLSDYPAQTLYETIPGFHDTSARYEKFRRVVSEDRMNRVKNCREEIDYILGRDDIAHFAADQIGNGLLPIRVTHNDTKLNNIMIDDITGKGICVLDLDTVMPGPAMNDFGDTIRFGTSTAAEDEKDVSKVSCDLELYDFFTRGFVEGCGGRLTPHEIETLPMGALCMTYEVGLRFLTDYLEGDVYFKTDYDDHNLVRSRTQIKLVKDMGEKWEDIQKIIDKYR